MENSSGQMKNSFEKTLQQTESNGRLCIRAWRQNRCNEKNQMKIKKKEWRNVNSIFKNSVTPLRDKLMNIGIKEELQVKDIGNIFKYSTK
jgi:hypothetical protein